MDYVGAYHSALTFDKTGTSRFAGPTSGDSPELRSSLNHAIDHEGGGGCSGPFSSAGSLWFVSVSSEVSAAGKFGHCLARLTALFSLCSDYAGELRMRRDLLLELKVTQARVKVAKQPRLIGFVGTTLMQPESFSYFKTRDGHINLIMFYSEIILPF